MINGVNNNNPTQRQLSPSVYKALEKSTINTELICRKLANSVANSNAKSASYQNKIKARINKSAPPKHIDIKKVANLKEFTLPHMWFVYTMSRFLTGGKEVEINIENNELKNIANSDEACIFIMNHDKQSQDPKLLSFFNALLAREYIYNGKADKCPIPKIVLNKDILDSSSKDKQILAQKWGAVGIDAAIHCADSRYNAKAFAKLVKGLCEDKNNIFIFPEGRMCAFSKMDPQWKFQTGIADIVRIAANKKGRVKVVPLGFAYKNNTGGIHIGEPIYFKKSGDSILFSKGTLDGKYQNADYVDYMKKIRAKDGYRPIMNDGKLVTDKSIGNYIAGILCENLIACKNKAAESIKDVGTINDTKRIYSITEKLDKLA